MPEFRIFVLIALTLFAQHVCLFDLLLEEYNLRMLGYVLLMSTSRLLAKLNKCVRRSPTWSFAGAPALLTFLRHSRAVIAAWLLLTMFRRYTSLRLLLLAYYFLAEALVHFMQESRVNFISVRRDLLLRSKKLFLRMLETAYFCFLLPLSAYDNISGASTVPLGLFLLVIALTQLAGLLGRQLARACFAEYAIFIRSVGYWYKVPFEVTGAVTVERAEWTARSDPRFLEGKTTVQLQDACYQKLSGAASLLDRAVLGLIGGSNTGRRVLLAAALAQTLLALLLARGWAAPLQLAGYLLLL